MLNVQVINVLVHRRFELEAFILHSDVSSVQYPAAGLNMKWSDFACDLGSKSISTSVSSGAMCDKGLVSAEPIKVEELSPNDKATSKIHHRCYRIETSLDPKSSSPREVLGLILNLMRVLSLSKHRLHLTNKPSNNVTTHTRRLNNLDRKRSSIT